MAKLLDPNDFSDFLQERQKADDGYIMCAIGQDPKKLSEWYFSGQYTGSQLKKANYWREHCERVWDCQGLADGYLTDTLGSKINVRARNNFADWCVTKGTGKIPTTYRVPGAAVFYHNGSYISHVGFLVKPVKSSNPDGDWYVVEARGVMYGVVRTKLLSRSWNRWGLMEKYFDYSDVMSEYHGVKAETTESSDDDVILGSRTLQKGDTGEDVKLLQEALVTLGYDLGKYGDNKDGIDGDFGNMTETAVKSFQTSQGNLEVDGVYGKNTHEALTEAIDELTDNDHAEDATHSVLSNGDKSDEVKEMQELLLKWNSKALPKYKADGDFGSETDEWVRAFQKEKELEVDGVVGKNTWAALLD